MAPVNDFVELTITDEAGGSTWVASPRHRTTSEFVNHTDSSGFWKICTADFRHTRGVRCVELS